MDGHMYCEIFPQNSMWSRRCVFRNFRPHRVQVAAHDHKFVTIFFLNLLQSSASAILSGWCTRNYTDKIAADLRCVISRQNVLNTTYSLENESKGYAQAVYVPCRK